MSAASLHDLMDRITTEAMEVWWRHEQMGTAPCASHFVPALAALARANRLYRRKPLLTTLSLRVTSLLPLLPRHALIAIRALGHMGGTTVAYPGVVGALLARLRGRNREAQLAVLEALRQMGGGLDRHPEALEEMAQILEEAPLEVGIACGRALLWAAQGSEIIAKQVSEWERRSIPARRALDAAREQLATVLEPESMDQTAGKAGERSPALIMRLVKDLEGRDMEARRRAAPELAEAMHAGVRIYRRRKEMVVVMGEEIRRQSNIVNVRRPSGKRR
jgi:hypothetical protein